MNLNGVLRMWQTWLISLIILVVIYFLQPQQIGVLLYKTFFITWGASVGYWVDRWLRPDDRPSESDRPDIASLRQAAIICAAMLAFALAV